MEKSVRTIPRKTMFKVFFAWQDEKEEKWLEEMSANGWRLGSVSPYLYTFIQSEAEQVIYRLDYKATLDKDYQEYLGLYQDAGWELAASMSNWHYFRNKPQSRSTPEIYTSERAKAQKYRRLLYGLIPFFAFFIVLVPRAVNSQYPRSATPLDIFYSITMLLSLGLVVFWIYAVLKIILKIRSLESKSRE